MAETKLTLNKNHFLVYEDFDGNTAVEERPLTNLDFANSLPLDGDTQVLQTTKHRYYYLNIDWERRPEYLNLEGDNWGLHIINIDTYGIAKKNTFCPSVMPKLYTKVKPDDAKKPDYITTQLCGNTKSKGTVNHANFKYDGFTIAGELTLDFNPSNKQSCFYYYDNYYKNYSPRSEILVEQTAYQEDWLNDETYYDDKIVHDRSLFKKSDNFDSTYYIGDSDERVKFVYKPVEKDNRVIHELHCYTDNQYSEPYYFDCFTEEYVSMKNDVSLVTFIPIKDKQDDMPGELKWMLCEFCRGIAASTNFTQVNRDDLPARIKYEWRPLTFKNKPKQAIIFTDEEFHEFLTIYQYVPNPTQEVSPTDSTIPVDAKGNFKSVEVHSYNINPQFVEYEPGKTVQVLIDNRDDENGEVNKHLKIYNRNADVYYVIADKFYSDSNTAKPVYENNDYVLLDGEGYPLYSPEILRNFGIGFLKASWVIYENGEFKACVRTDELSEVWYADSNAQHKTNYDIFNEDGTLKDYYIEGPIYSTKYLMVPDNDGTYKWADANKLTWENGYKIDNEEIIYEYGPYLVYNQQYIVDETHAHTTFEIPYICKSRQTIYKTQECYGAGILTMAKEENTDVWAPIDYYEHSGPPPTRVMLKMENEDTDNPTYQFLTWKKSISDSNVSYSYSVRYKIDEATLSTVDKGPQYKNFAFWTINDNKDVLTTIDNYSNIGPVYETVDNETKQIIREIQYIITYTLALDNIPINPYIGTLLPNTWSYAQTLKQAFLQGHIVSVKSVSKDSAIPQEEYLEEQIKQIKFMTPSEYYSDKFKLIDDEDSSQNWFWLDTLSNWCRYELFEDGSTIMLKLWNGLGGWDDIQAIMKEINLNDNNKLLKNFLYNKDFFVYGFEFPTNNSKDFIQAYNPVVPKNVGDAHNPKVDRGQIHYFTLVLPKDTRSMLYKTNMSNYNEQFNYNGDYNDYARMFYPDNKEGTTPKLPDDTRKYAIGIATQYCPCVMKMRTDELAICIYLTAQVSNELGYYKNIITPEEANIRCKQIFGDGADKTIENDWKRYFKNDRSEEKESEVRDTNDDTIFNAQSSILVRGSDTINTIRIYAMRPNPTTNNKEIQDYLERWDK